MVCYVFRSLKKAFVICEMSGVSAIAKPNMIKTPATSKAVIKGSIRGLCLMSLSVIFATH